MEVTWGMNRPCLGKDGLSLSLSPPPAQKEKCTGPQGRGGKGSGAGLPKTSVKKDQTVYFFFHFKSVMDQYLLKFNKNKLLFKNKMLLE